MESFNSNIVMLIDDDPVSNFLTKGIIEETITSEMEINIAENGSEALELVNQLYNVVGPCRKQIKVITSI